MAKLNVRYKGGLVYWSARTAESQRIVSLVQVWFTRVHKRAIDGTKTFQPYFYTSVKTTEIVT